MRALLPSLLSDAVGSPEHTISELNTQPADTPVQRFKCSLTTALTWLGARVVRYSLPVRLFHSLLHAGLSRRYPDETVCPTVLVAQAVSPANRVARRLPDGVYCQLPGNPNKSLGNN